MWNGPTAAVASAGRSAGGEGVRTRSRKAGAGSARKSSVTVRARQPAMAPGPHRARAPRRRLPEALDLLAPDPPGLENHPVTHVSWYAAKAFCEWAGGRLPSVKEWQAAAHTAESRFPWGPVRPAVPPLNFCDRACPRRGQSFGPDLEQDGCPETAPVGSFPAGRTREGVYDLSGNVWEWTAEASGTRRATLGGSHLAQFDECSTDRPLWEEATLCAPDGSFRCVGGDFTHLFRVTMFEQRASAIMRGDFVAASSAGPVTSRLIRQTSGQTRHV